MTPSGRRGVGGIRSCYSNTRVPHWLFDIPPPVIIYAIMALPEGFLFRGVTQNLLTRSWGPRVGLWIAVIVFGLAHLPDLRYVILSTLQVSGMGGCMSGPERLPLQP